MSKRRLIFITFLSSSLAILPGCQDFSNDTVKAEIFAEKNKTASIFGGQLVAQQELLAHSIAAISFLNGTGDREICSGSIVAKRVVLTAAHCAKNLPSEIKVLFQMDLSQTNSIMEGESRNVQRVIRHPEYEARQKEIVGKWELANDYDLALLILDSDVPTGFVPFMIVRNFPSMEEKNTLSVAGYGAEFYDPLSGERKGEIILKEVMLKRLVSEQAGVLIFDQSNGKGICVGDSGGPSFFEAQGQLWLVGVASSVRNPGKSAVCEGVSRYIGIANLRNWLQDNIFEASASLEKFGI